MKNTLRLVLFAVIAANILAGCGGSTSTVAAPVATTPPPVVTPPAPVTGVATPKAVSVVTAN